MATTMHMRWDVRGLLRRPLSYLGKQGFRHDDGRKATGAEVRDWLLDELAKGHNYIPLGQCDNFDYKEKGCLGHEHPDESTEVAHG